jgi:hypothetical protein
VLEIETDWKYKAELLIEQAIACILLFVAFSSTFGLILSFLSSFSFFLIMLLIVYFMNSRLVISESGIEQYTGYEPLLVQFQNVDSVTVTRHLFSSCSSIEIWQKNWQIRVGQAGIDDYRTLIDFLKERVPAEVQFNTRLLPFDPLLTGPIGYPLVMIFFFLLF